jgi:hypothetical protein
MSTISPNVLNTLGAVLAPLAPEGTNPEQGFSVVHLGWYSMSLNLL